MSVVAKTRHTSKKAAAFVPVTVGDDHWKGSALAAEELLKFMSKHGFIKADDTYIDASDVFVDDHEKYGKGNFLLRGYRLKLGLTQSELAKKVGVRQPDIANLEKGKRPIGKELAKKFARVFDTDYRSFL